MENLVLKGTPVVELLEDKILITRGSGLGGAISFMEGQGDEVIFIKNILSIEVRRCSFYNSGYLRISTASGKKEIIFGGWGRKKRRNYNDIATKIAKYVIEKI